MKNCGIRFVENLKMWMKEKSISQAGLAKELSVDQTTISAWLRGESEPTLTKICLLLGYFDATFEDLIE